jgi:hypothetical protein
MVLDPSHSLVDRFARAGLALQVKGVPLRPTSNDGIVQLNIGRGRSKAEEHFRLWPGARDNRIEVLGTDKALEQLVLMIHEPRRRFELEVSKSQAEHSGERIVRIKGRRAVIERFTDSSKRHFLCGMDEQHCFIAQLPQPVSAVSRAHEVLKPVGFEALSRRAQRKSVRQGEFFFAPLSADELKRCVQLGQGVRVHSNSGIAEAAGWARAGRQHQATSVWPVDVVNGVVLVRGQVRHPDHKMLHFPEWVRVLQNREAYERPPPGVLWVD